MAPFGPHSRRNRLDVLDKRSREARALREIRDDLTRHCGGSPSATQARLIERAAVLSLYLKMFDARALEARAMSDRDARQYLAFSNSYSRILAQLELKPAPAHEQTIGDLLQAGRAA